MKTFTFTAAAAMVLAASLAFAQAPTRPGPPRPRRPPSAAGRVGPAFVDANGDGICDNLAAVGSEGGARVRTGQRHRQQGRGPEGRDG